MPKSYEEQCLCGWRTAAVDDNAKVREGLAGNDKTDAGAEDDAKVRALLGQHEERCLRGWRTAVDADNAKFGAWLGSYEEQCVRRWRTAANDDNVEVKKDLAGTVKTEAEAADEDDPSCCQT